MEPKKGKLSCKPLPISNLELVRGFAADRALNMTGSLRIKTQFSAALIHQCFIVTVL